MDGILYVVSTPIGNLEDMTFRAIRILKESSVIAAEDTRHTQKLCNYYQIGTPLTSYHDFNKEEKTPVLLHRLHEGLPVSLVCDAGTPMISDPGFYLVRRAIEEKISIVPIPGPSSVLTALCASGLPTDQFRFEGFVPKKPGAREKLFQHVKEQSGTLIFFDTQHRVLKTLSHLLEIVGNRQIVVARELTKLNEEFLRGTVEEVTQQLHQKPIKGEITLLVQGMSARKRNQKNSSPLS
ncbi:MAG: 16S rRNA (cytidine(1402)-2'-O)-methyltransferase [Nitrospirales bacterium]|nr:16S rRNA (cytidine(1402)-2'-O)-methyltransferase [Nitrospirales bacterium]